MRNENGNLRMGKMFIIDSLLNSWSMAWRQLPTCQCLAFWNHCLPWSISSSFVPHFRLTRKRRYALWGRSMRQHTACHQQCGLATFHLQYTLFNNFCCVWPMFCSHNEIKNAVFENQDHSCLIFMEAEMDALFLVESTQGSCNSSQSHGHVYLAIPQKHRIP